MNVIRKVNEFAKELIRRGDVYLLRIEGREMYGIVAEAGEKSLNLATAYGQVTVRPDQVECGDVEIRYLRVEQEPEEE